jgi:hypothetical protein
VTGTVRQLRRNYPAEGAALEMVSTIEIQRIGAKRVVIKPVIKKTGVSRVTNPVASWNEASYSRVVAKPVASWSEAGQWRHL